MVWSRPCVSTVFARAAVGGRSPGRGHGESAVTAGDTGGGAIPGEIGRGRAIWCRLTRSPPSESDALHLVFFLTSWMILEWTADELMQLMLIVLAPLKLSDALTSSYAVLHVHATNKETECRMLLTYTSTHVNLDCISFKWWVHVRNRPT
jgi:hypothetical protein